MKHKMDLRDFAIAYAQAGLSVLPCQGKEPVVRNINGELLTPNGCLNATSDQRIVKDWWKDAPNANIGIRCGTRILVIDSDIKRNVNGHEIVNGEKSIELLSKDLGVLPDGPVSMTGGGGRHRFFQCPDPVPIAHKNVAGMGIDIQVGNQYVVAPPSLHPGTQQRYRWITLPISFQNGAWILKSLPQLPTAWLEWIIKPHTEQKESDTTGTSKPNRLQRVREIVREALKRTGKRVHPASLTFDQVKARARGKWKCVLECLCPDTAFVTDASNRWHTCPCCQKAGKFRLFDDFNDTGTCICYKCHEKAGDGIATVAWLFDCPSNEARELLSDLLQTDLMK